MNPPVMAMIALRIGDFQGQAVKRPVAGLVPPDRGITAPVIGFLVIQIVTGRAARCPKKVGLIHAPAPKMALIRAMLMEFCVHTMSRKGILGSRGIRTDHLSL